MRRSNAKKDEDHKVHTYIDHDQGSKNRREGTTLEDFSKDRPQPEQVEPCNYQKSWGLFRLVRQLLSAEG